MDNLQLLNDLINIIWEWEWDENGGNDDSDNSDGHPDDPTSDHVNHYLHSSAEESDGGNDDVDSGFQLPLLTHVVTFKCVGTTHDTHAQEILAKVTMLLQNEEVPVKITPEPTNQYDAKAICFKCFVDGEWHRIGYVVREALDHVHDALSEKKIISVKFSWVKYLAVWSRCGPGFYAGVKIAKSGEWHPDVMKCSSTR